jgi:hypothetical protein
MDNAEIYPPCVGVRIAETDATYSAINFVIKAPGATRTWMYLQMSDYCKLDCDRILQCMTELAVASIRSELAFEGFTNVHETRIGCTNVGDFLSMNAWQTCMKMLAANEAQVVLRQVSLSQEHWNAIHSIKSLCSSAPIPASFWRVTEAFRVSFKNEEHGVDFGVKETIQALSAVGMRVTPLADVSFHKIQMPSGSAAYEKAFLDALRGVRNFSVRLSFYSSPESWKRIWLSPTLQMNNSLLEVDLSGRGHYYPHAGDEALNMASLEAIRECMLVNWFIIRIKLPGCYMGTDATKTYWQTNIEPLLELNRSHCPRLAPDEQRLSVLHDAVVHVRNHPDKLRNLLHKYPQIWGRLTMRNRYEPRAHPAAQMAQDQEIDELRRRARAQQRESIETELQIEDPQRRERNAESFAVSLPDFATPL